MATKIEVLNSADKIVSAQIAQRRPPMFETLKSAYEQIGALASVSKGLREDGDCLPSEFSLGITAVIRNLSAFHSGYASNDASQAVAGQVTKRAGLSEFIGYVKAEIEKSLKEDATEALARLRAVSGVIKAGLDEIEKSKDGEIAKSEGISIPVSNDSMQVQTTAAGGSLAPSGTSLPSTAASNFATNPGDINAAAPSSAPNTSSGSVAALAGTGTGGAAAAPFTGAVDPAFPAGATPGAPAGTAASLAVTGGATSTGAEDVTKAAEKAAKDAEIAKAAKVKEDEEILKAAEELRSVAEKAGKNGRKRDGWALDLNSKEFLEGKRAVDFGSDGSPTTR